MKHLSWRAAGQNWKVKTNLKLNNIMAQKGQKIDTTILDTGIKDVANFQTWGHYFAEDGDGFKKISTSQLRKFFGALKQIQADFENKKSDVVLLDAKLAYAVGRDVDKKTGKNTSKIKVFYDELSPLIKNIKEDKVKFKRFIDVFEAIVAYHKEKEEVKPENRY